MNFEINEMEYFPIPQINQLNKYETVLEDGVKENEIYKTNILIKINYFDNELECFDKVISLPFELNLGDKELINLTLTNVDINVIDNQGINVEYNLDVEISEVEHAFDNEDLSFKEVDISYLEDTTIEDIKETVTSSYEDLLDNSGIREELPIKYVDNEEKIHSNLKDDFVNVKVLFNVNVDSIDKLAFKYNLSVDNCFKKLTSDKTRLII
ncbi:MAG: hypothetical protein R3Y60_04140 [bacterium]